MSIRTVRRTSIEARQMWDKATKAVSYTLAGYFVGQDVEIKGARAYFDRMVELGIAPKITATSRGYTLHYHSNHWLELEVAS